MSIENNEQRITKHIFVTGGVVSSLGKGLTAATLGNLLTARGLHVVMQKLDPYLNVDPGSMNPFEHGEVFVTEDGAETDLDIGHYERFLDINLDGAANVTTGQIYSSVIARERAGGYAGQTVQVIPHITNEIKHRMRLQAAQNPQPDVIITEVGGTVGDIESQPFLEAARQVRHELGRSNVFFLHVSLVPFMGASGEQKTKPTQHSVAALRSIGIQPDALVLRSDRPVTDDNQRKIALMCDVEENAVVNAIDVESIYDLPTLLHAQNLDSTIINALGLNNAKEVDWSRWQSVINAVHNPVGEVTVALVAGDDALPDAYLSLTAALAAGGFAHATKVNVRWVTASKCETPEEATAHLHDVHALCVPSSFEMKSFPGKLGALKFARENGIPTLGIGLGMQVMVIEHARNVAGIAGAASTEFDPHTPNPIIINNGTDNPMRLGAREIQLAPGSLAEKIYGATTISERHRHAFRVNHEYIDKIKEAGLTISGTSFDGETSKNGSNETVEFVELAQSEHNFYVATTSNPELKSRPARPHPLFASLIAHAIERREASKLI
ncbi:MAG TPA: CTP synthase [Microbacteriaceae bacterium]|nr:CTP synthase [Microbacteriaceae bacterium]